ncbi:MAG: isocitrate lyase/phosphoenolpyruvate mutase family protein [Burkholderiaceae bacterium]|nr:isocitrate lyase/phosphoenolpyruvate mutase family protein [Burkholderiaceae bacterium]
MDEATRSALQQKGEALRALHGREGVAFVIPNPWDIGTARLLASLGFEALATTSAGCAFSLGVVDNRIDRDTAIAHVRALADATALPLSADLENGFGDDPETAADTIRRAAAAGAVGGSIEDTNTRNARPQYEFAHAVERVRAAAEAARSLDFPFTLTARAENFLAGNPDLRDTIRRLQAYQDAGADVLYAPGLPTREAVVEVVRSVDRPVNVLMGSPALRMNVAELAALGVRRISVGSALSRAALGAFLRAAREIRENGSFGFGAEAVGYAEINAMFAQAR